jgi:hypothetical protein
MRSARDALSLPGYEQIGSSYLQIKPAVNRLIYTPDVMVWVCVGCNLACTLRHEMAPS